MTEWRRCGRYEVSDDGRVRTKHELCTRLDSDGYVMVGRGEKVHRLVLRAFVGPAPPGYEADHINRDRADNRLVNLRWVTRSQNLRGTRRPNKSGTPGVRFREDRLNPWQAYIQHEGRMRSVGHFSSQAEAVAARSTRLRELGYDRFTSA